VREKAAYSSAWWLVGVKSARFAFFLLSRRAQCRARELGCKILSPPMSCKTDSSGNRVSINFAWHANAAWAPCLACLASPPMREPQPRTPPQLLLPFPSCYIRITGQCSKFPSMAHRDWFDDLGFGGPNCSVLSPQRAALRCKQRATSWRIDCDRGSTGVNTDVDWFFGPRALLPELEGNLTRWCVLLLGVHTLAHTTQTARSPQRCEVTLATLSAGCDRSCRSAPV